MIIFEYIIDGKKNLFRQQYLPVAASCIKKHFLTVLITLTMIRIRGIIIGNNFLKNYTQFDIQMFLCVLGKVLHSSRRQKGKNGMNADSSENIFFFFLTAVLHVKK